MTSPCIYWEDIDTVFSVKSSFNDKKAVFTIPLKCQSSPYPSNSVPVYPYGYDWKLSGSRTRLWKTTLYCLLSSFFSKAFVLVPFCLVLWGLYPGMAHCSSRGSVTSSMALASRRKKLNWACLRMLRMNPPTLHSTFPSLVLYVDFCKAHREKTEVPDPLAVEDLISYKLIDRRKLQRLITHYRDIFSNISEEGRSCLPKYWKYIYPYTV